MRAGHRLAGIRSRLLLATILSVGAALLVLVVAFNLLFARRLDANATDQARARAAAELSVLDVSSGRVRVGEAADAATGDATVWVFAGGRGIEAPRVAPALGAAAARLAATHTATANVDGADVRLAAVPISQGGRDLGTVVAGVPLAPYEQAQRTALIASIILSVVVLGIVALVARWILARALRPVSTMTASARAWSDRDLERRFGLGPPYDELTSLAATLDDLLERNAAALRREQRLSAEISHELRTPLARIATEAELALRRQRTEDEYRNALTTVERNARTMTRIIDALLGAARAEAGMHRGSASALDVAHRAVAASADIAAARDLDVAVTSTCADPRVAIDAELASRILQPVLDNACRYGRTAVNVTVGCEDHCVAFTVCDDGTGVRAAETERIFEPGVRGSHDAIDPSGAGLGLPLARRLAESVGGTVRASAAVGGSFTVRLPAGR